MSTDLNQMQYFIQVYEDKKISTAASHLFVSQQYVSRIIQRLETDLETDLFVRTSKGLIPTKAGDETYCCFKEIINRYQTLLTSLKTIDCPQEQGHLRVVLDIGLVQLMTPEPFLSFTYAYPGINVILEEHRIFNCKKLLINNQADIVFSAYVGWHEKFPCKKILSLSSFILLKKDHPLARKSEISVYDLADQPLLSSGCPSYYTMLQEFHSIRKKPVMPIAINELQSIFDYILNDTGIAPLVVNPREDSLKLPHGIIAIPYKTSEPLNIYAYWKASAPTSHLSEIYADYLNKQF